MAAEEGEYTSVEIMLRAGAKFDEADRLGFTALGLACENGHAEVAKLLMSASADPNKPRSNGWSHLITAAYNGGADVIEALIAGKAECASAHKGRIVRSRSISPSLTLQPV